MKSKLVIGSLASVALFALTACGGNKIKINPDKQKYKVGICQIVAHEALDSATNGFKTKLTQLLATEGRQVEYIYQEAAGEISTCSTIINSFISSDVDLIMANATPVLQTAANATRNIPVLGTSITEYGVALGIKNFSGVVGTNVSGTSDLSPLTEQVDAMFELVPNAKNVGILFCSGEANSKYQVDEVKKAINAKGGITVTEYAFTDSNDISAICTTAATNSDLIYVPTDNTAASNATIIDNICAVKNVPVFAGEEGLCKKCGFATLSISYNGIGEKTAQMAFNVLLGKQDITKYAIQYDDSPVKKYDAARCLNLGINIPSGKGWEPIVSE